MKKSTSELKEAIISIAAILNKHERGEIHFGINPNGEIVGQCVSDATLREISKSISDFIEPKIFPKIEQVAFEDKCCIKVEFEGKEIPYFAYGRAYIRTGTENKQISARELEKMILDKNKENLRWDNQICEKASLRDVDENLVKQFLEKAKLPYSKMKDSLKRLEVLSENKILNAGILLFSKNPSKFFKSAKLRCAVFAREDTAVIIDRKEFEGDILYLIQKAEDYILENIHTGMKVEGLYRIDVPEIDKEAIREALINAFCHRDYREYESVEVAIFKDRLEIRNPGGIFGEVTLEQIIKGQAPSKRRNPLIADLFKRIHFGERWGRGIKLILSKEPEAQFKDFGDFFVIAFKRKYKDEYIQKTSGEKTTQKTTQKILDLIREMPTITRKELAEKIELSEEGIKFNLSQLKKQGKLKRVGPDKGGHWEVLG